MKNLIIGNTSQLSYFFPDDYVRISSRNIDFKYLKQNDWDSVYITFAEQRVHLNDVEYIPINYMYTGDIIGSLSNNSKRIVVYTSCELWNNYIGRVSIDDDVSYTYSNNYCLSKKMLMDHINDFRKLGKWNNVVIIHPFNFNSTYRRSDFLFGKVFDSIINKKKIEIGDTYFYRDIVHTKYMVERSIAATKDDMVSSGRLTFVNDFIRDLYGDFKMDYDEYVTENINNKARHSEKLYYSKQDKVYTYDMLLYDTIDDIEKRIEK